MDLFNCFFSPYTFKIFIYLTDYIVCNYTFSGKRQAHYNFHLERELMQKKVKLPVWGHEQHGFITVCIRKEKQHRQQCKANGEIYFTSGVRSQMFPLLWNFLDVLPSSYSFYSFSALKILSYYAIEYANCCFKWDLQFNSQS